MAGHRCMSSWRNPRRSAGLRGPGISHHRGGPGRRHGYGHCACGRQDRTAPGLQNGGGGDKADALGRLGRLGLCPGGDQDAGLRGSAVGRAVGRMTGRPCLAGRSVARRRCDGRGISGAADDVGRVEGANGAEGQATASCTGGAGRVKAIPLQLLPAGSTFFNQL